MAITKKEFGNTKEGNTITLYSIKNKNNIVADIMDFGAILVNLCVPDKNGDIKDIVLGYDRPESYFGNWNMFGAIIGPSANRIGDARFILNGITYEVPKNDYANNLHSDFDKGYHKRLWDAEINNNSVIFSLEDEDGTMGFPGNKKVQVIYTLTDDNELKIDYYVTSDKDTLINMTNHSYFNLEGHDSGTIENHEVQINASYYTPVNEFLIPTGELAQVEATPFDFRLIKPVNRDIDSGNIQIKYAKGYDHNWVIDDYDGTVKKAAIVRTPATGITMEVYTDQQGIQFYTASGIGQHTGKAGVVYDTKSGLCFETQAFPDSVNKDNFPNVIYGPERPYKTTTIYKFVIE